MNDDHEALRLADALEKAPAHTLKDGTITLYLGGTVVADNAAACLRRQHEECDALRAIVQSVSTRVPHILAGGQQCTCSWCDDIRAARAALKEAK